MSSPDYIPLDFPELSPEEMRSRSRAFLDLMARRRSVRDFSDRPVDRAVIEACVRTAGSSPSGANQQPWHFVVVSDPHVKSRIREAAEKEERAFYEQRATEEWLNAISPMGTDASKPFLETAPYLIAVFAQRHGIDNDGNKAQHYYVAESVGIATGLLISAVHNAGLACLTHTPSPMGFLNEILDRPDNERPFLLLVVGHPAPDTRVPNVARKSLSQIATFI
jgi:iodotyrosine deiodinase